MKDRNPKRHNNQNKAIPLEAENKRLRLENEELLEKTESLAKAVVERKKTEDMLRRSEERINHLNYLKEKLLVPAALDEKLKHITDTVVEIFDADFARIWMTKPGDLCDSGCIHSHLTEGPHVCKYRQRCLHLMASSGRYTHTDGTVHRRVPFGCYKIGRVAAGADSKFVTNDATHDPRVHNHEWARELGLVSFAGYRLLSADGKPIGVLALFSKHAISANDNALLENIANTTSQVIVTAKAEMEAGEAQTRIETILSQCSFAVVVIDRNRTIRWANTYAARLAGLKNSDELIGKYCGEYLCPAIQCECLVCSKDQTIDNSERILRRFDGQEIPILKTITEVEMYGELMLLETFVDIGDQKEAEAALIQAKKEAESASIAKGQFLANMSHEIRTPMNAIIGFTNLLAAEDLTEDQQDYVTRVADSSEHLLHLINDIMDFSKVEAGKLDVEFVEFSLEKILDKLHALFSVQAETKGIEFRIHTSPDVPLQICSDVSRLSQCLTNIVNNAIKFTDKGHVYVNIALEEKDSHPFIRFDIEDTGIGIPKEQQEIIFESFTQADGSMTRKYGGTGLGLTITKQLVNLLGGELTVVSEQDIGSTFSLVIPTNIDTTNQPFHSQPGMGDQAPSSQSDASPLAFSGNVLVAEDQPSNQTLIRLLLEKMDLSVTVVENGREVLQEVLTEQYDLIFMDMMMPCMNGYEATKELRNKGITIPVIALTAAAMRGDKEKCLQAGCDHYLAKPLDRRELVKIIRKYLPSTEAALINTASQ